MINTAKVERRKLRFESIEEVLADVDSLVASAQAGTLQSVGNWTSGQVMAHLAAWIEYGYEGYPVKAPPWILRFILKLMLPGMLKHGMRPGVKIPGIAGGTTGQEDQPLDQAAARLKKAFLRLNSGEQCSYDSPAFGPMSHADRIRLNLRHAELHLSFLR
ncbi:MAG: DUF1569 domain-containing protein [Pirellulaceae bacterium]|nr:DUF1569 domain-containing protein [Pirellulaceae bacterium]